MGGKRASNPFVTHVGFCPRCGSILPSLEPHGGINCCVCGYEMDVKSLDGQEVKYTVRFNSRTSYEDERKLKMKRSEPDGPVVERQCPSCGHNKMTYAALQLRSADEGQTVFYTCVECQFQDRENS